MKPGNTGIERLIDATDYSMHGLFICLLLIALCWGSLLWKIFLPDRLNAWQKPDNPRANMKRLSH